MGSRLVGLGVLALFLSLLALSGPLAETQSGETKPKYFVDGARPTRVEGRFYTGDEGCVPYSSGRADVMICGPVPDDYVPAPPARFDAELCGVAEQRLEQLRENLRAAGAGAASVEAAHPAVVSSTCLVQELESPPGPGFDHMVSFRAADPQKTDRVMIALDVK